MILDLGLAARLVVGIRTETARRHGCPEWETAGVAAALKGSEGSPGAVLAAMCLAAEDPALRLPSVNAVRAHWPKNATTSGPPISHNVPCPEHPEHDMPHDHGTDTPEQIAAGIAAARAALAAAPTYVPPAVKRARALEGTP